LENDLFTVGSSVRNELDGEALGIQLESDEGWKVHFHFLDLLAVGRKNPEGLCDEPSEV